MRKLEIKNMNHFYFNFTLEVVDIHTIEIFGRVSESSDFLIR